MYKLNLSLLVTTFSIAALANDADIVKKFEEFSTKAKNMSVSISTPLCLNCSLQEESFSECVYDICSMSKIKENYQITASKLITENFSNPTSKAEALKVYDEAYKAFYEMLSLDLDKEILTKENHLKVLDQGLFTENDGARFTAAVGFLINGSDLPEGPFKQQSQRFQKYLDEVREVLEIYYLEPSSYYSIKHPNIPIKEAVQKDLDQTTKLITELTSTTYAQQVPSLIEGLKREISQGVYVKLKEGKDISIEDTKIILDNLATLNLLTHLIKKEDFKKDMNSIDLKSLQQSIKNSKMKPNLTAMLKSLKQFKNHPVMASTVTYCVNEFMAAYIALPDPELRTKALAEINKTKENFSKNVLTMFSEESKKKLEEASKNWKFTIPTNREYFNTFKTDVRVLHEGNKGEYKADQAAPLSSHAADLSYELEPLMYPEDNDDFFRHIVDDVLVSTAEICKGIPSKLNDAAYTVNGSIIASWPSVRNLNLGKAVAAHELGHMLSKAMKKGDVSSHSKKVYSDTMSCLVRKGTEQYKEENFADLVAAKIESSSKNNLFCTLPFEYDPKLPTMLQNKNPTDTHASDFSRLLNMERAFKKSLPASCTKHISGFKLGDIHSCWGAANSSPSQTNDQPPPTTSTLRQ